MAHKKKRRPGGHPANIAAKRQRDEQLALNRQNPERAAAKALARSFVDVEDAVDAEIGASFLLSQAYPEEIGLGDDPELLEEDIFLPLVASLFKLGDEAALAALWALGETSTTDVGVVARDARDKLVEHGIAPPWWGPDLSSAKLVRAVELREPIFDDGFSAILEFEHGAGIRSAVSVMIDNNATGSATGIAMTESIEQIEQFAEIHSDGELKMQVVDVDEGLVAGRILHGIDLTDNTLGFEPDDDFRTYRALARGRAFHASQLVVEDGLYEADLSEEERDHLLDGFLASEHARALAGEVELEELRWLATLPIDFSLDYTYGGALRWSPVKIEQFMRGWVPRKVLSSNDELEALPDVLEAFVSYSGRRRKMPKALLSECSAMVARCAPLMFEEVESGEAGGASMDFLRAATEAGVDLTDEAAVATFIAGWNARSDLGD
jgi:hypothetical protein